MARSRKKKKRTSATGRQATEKLQQPPTGGAVPQRTVSTSRASRIAFALGVGGTLVLLMVGLYESIRTQGRLPGVSTAYMRYIESLFQAGDQERAMEQLRLARALDIVNEHLILNNLGNALQARGETAEAIPRYREAIRIKPDYAMAHYNLGKALAEQGDANGAVQHYRATLELNPAHVDAHNNLANLLAGRGAFDEAIEHYLRVLSLKPDAAATHNNLAWVLTEVGRLDEALAHFEHAVRLEPELPPSLIGLSWILATRPADEQRDPGRALGLAERALELLPTPDPRSLDIAAAAYAAVGDYDRAVELAETAIDLAPPDFPDLHAIHERLALYRQRRPYREEEEDG
jgi:tetratricopeptide (TPR) repeat protein